MPYAMYLRKSQADRSDESTEEVLAKHRKMLTGLATQMGVRDIEMYEEVISGESLYARPEMLRLLEQVEAGAYDGVFCADIDRLGRGSMADQGIILEAFRVSETLIITPGKTYDLTNDADEELTEMKALFARFELKQIRKRMRRGLMQTVEAGGYVANPPYGYRKCTVGKLPSLEINEDQAKFIRHVYRRYLEGVGAQTIADELNAMGSIPNRSAQWSRNTIRHVLRNPTYAGKVAWNRVKHYKPTKENPHIHVVHQKMEDWIMVDGLHPAIIPWEDWQRVQDIRKGRYIPSQNHGQVANPLAGLVVCGNCGRNMQRMGQNRGEPYLLCTQHGCIASAQFRYVEDRLLSDLEDILRDLRIEVKQDAGTDTSALEATVRAADGKIKRCDAKIARLYDLLEDGTYDRDTFKARMEKAQSERAVLTVRRDEAQAAIDAAAHRDTAALIGYLDTLLDLYPTLDPAGRNQLLKAVVKRIIYHKEKKTKPMDFSLDIELKQL